VRYDPFFKSLGVRGLSFVEKSQVMENLSLNVHVSLSIQYKGSQRE